MICTPILLEEELEYAKKQLVAIASKHQYNFLHPKVIAASQELDLLILRSMKS